MFELKIMRIRSCALALAISVLPRMVSAQASNPVATAFRGDLKDVGKNLMDAADLMPADKFGYKPTPAQMSWGDIMLHLAGGNDFMCAAIGGVPAPTRTKLVGTDDKAKLVARLRETFQFCDQAVAKVDDSKLGEQLPFFGGSKASRAAIMLDAAGDWEDHYSQLSIYLRLNGLLPPTAKKPPA
jgi:hypothetical protein